MSLVAQADSCPQCAHFTDPVEVMHSMMQHRSSHRAVLADQAQNIRVPLSVRAASCPAAIWICNIC